jgi:hypothetical protein
VISEEEKVLIRINDVWRRYSKRIGNLPKHLQDILLDDLETAIENRLKVLEAN